MVVSTALTVSHVDEKLTTQKCFHCEMDPQPFTPLNLCSSIISKSKNHQGKIAEDKTKV